MIDILFYFIIPLLLLVSVIANYRSLKKIENYEGITEDFMEFGNTLNTQLNLSREKLDEMDHNGMFEADDEVGDFFKTMEVIQTALEKFKITYKEDAEETQKEQS